MTSYYTYLLVTVISRLLLVALLLTHFYGKKNGEDGQSSGNNSETPIDVEENDADLASVVKRRRVTAAQAQEERKQKEKEERIRYSISSAYYYYFLYQIRFALFSFFFLPHIECTVKFGLTLYQFFAVYRYPP